MADGMTDACDHDWHRSDLMGCSVCPRCHGVRFHDEPPPGLPQPVSGRRHDWSTVAGDRECVRCGCPVESIEARNACPVPPPVPAIGDALGKALRGSGSFDAIDRRFKR